MKNKSTDRELLEILLAEIQKLNEKVDVLSESINAVPQWISIIDVAREKGLSKEAVRNRVVNGKEFNPEEDYILDGNRLLINKRILKYINRQRKRKKS